jgi:hypothetical protein
VERCSELTCNEVSPELWRRSDRSHVRKRFVVWRCLDRLEQWVVVVVLWLEVGSSVVWRQLFGWTREGWCISLARRPLLWPRCLLLRVVTLSSPMEWVGAAVGCGVGDVAQRKLFCFFRWPGVALEIGDVFPVHSESVKYGRRWWCQLYGV